MKIYYAGYFSSNPYNNPSGLNLDFHFLKSLEFYSKIYRSSISINDFSNMYLDLSQEELSDMYSEFLYDEISKIHYKEGIDIFMSSFLDDDIIPGLISKISRLGILTISFNMDYYYGIRFSRKLISHYDYVLISNSKFENEVKKHDSNPIQVDFASNPFYYYPRSEKKNYKSVFIGSYDSLRESKLNYLYRKGIKTFAFGSGWDSNFVSILMSKIPFTLSSTYRKGILKDLDYLNLLNQSDAYINFGVKVVRSDHFQSDKVEYGLSLKDFEIPMSGSFYIRFYNKKLAEFFKEDQEMVFYRDEKELLDKLTFYMNNKSERMRIINQAYKKVVNEHTWFSRIPKIFGKLNIKMKIKNNFNAINL